MTMTKRDFMKHITAAYTTDIPSQKIKNDWKRIIKRCAAEYWESEKKNIPEVFDIQGLCKELVAFWELNACHIHG